jgi:protein kinase C substrate 80K-H
MIVILRLLVACVLAGAAAGGQERTQIRGVVPDLATKYMPRGHDATFECLDGSRTIPFSAVNDDFCDCPGDGSDEPGKAGIAYCRAPDPLKVSRRAVSVSGKA